MQWAGLYMCNVIMQSEFSEEPSGSIIAPVTSIGYETWEGNPPPPGIEPNGTKQVGDSFELEVVDENLLRTTRLSRMSHLNGRPLLVKLADIGREHRQVRRLIEWVTSRSLVVEVGLNVCRKPTTDAQPSLVWMAAPV